MLPLYTSYSLFVIKESLYFRSPPFLSVHFDENEGLKVGDRVIYVGKKYRESIGNQVMEVVKISVQWLALRVLTFLAGLSSW